MAALTALIQADLLAFQAASATCLVMADSEVTGTGGLLQSPVPTLGHVNWTATTKSTYSTPIGIETAAFLLVASGIKNFKL